MRGIAHPGAAGDSLPRLYPGRNVRGNKLEGLDRIMARVPPWAESFGEAFGGSGVVGWRAKTLGLRVATNDVMAFACLRARALIANGRARLDRRDLDMLDEPNPRRLGIAREWYAPALGYASAAWLDDLAANLPRLDGPAKRDVAAYVAVVVLMGRMNFPQVRFRRDRRFAGRRHLDGFDWGREFRRHALGVFPRLLHDNGMDNEACRQDAPDFVRSHPVDCLYLDPPYVGPSRYEQDLGFYDKLCLLLEGRHAEVGDPLNGRVALPPHTNFATRNSALMGLALIFRAARARRIVLSYNSTSGIHPDEIVADGERIYGPLVDREEWVAPLPTARRDRPRETRDVLLVFDRDPARPPSGHALDSRVQSPAPAAVLITPPREPSRDPVNGSLCEAIAHGKEASMSSPGVKASSPSKPLFRWQGGKQRLRKLLVRLFPTGYARYIEPFVGAGSVYLAVRHAGFGGPALLGDFNPDVVEAHRAVSSDPEAFMAAYRVHVERHCRDHFYRLRDQDADGWTAAEKAARTVYLAKAAFHGLYRVNAQGKVVSTYGTGEPGRIRLSAEHIRAVAEAFRQAEIRHGDFGWVGSVAEEGDLVSMDPPYFGGNTAFVAGGFGLDDQMRLCRLCRALDARGVRFIQTNANRSTARELYRGFRMLAVPPAPAIGCGGVGRQPEGELVICNFEPTDQTTELKVVA